MEVIGGGGLCGAAASPLPDVSTLQLPVKSSSRSKFGSAPSPPAAPPSSAGSGSGSRRLLRVAAPSEVAGVAAGMESRDRASAGLLESSAPGD